MRIHKKYKPKVLWFQAVTCNGNTHSFLSANSNRMKLFLNSFDLIYLDIQIPGKTGIEVAEGLNEDAVIIFATAYDQYAVKAFEAQALDYVLKPIDEHRFAQVMARVRTQLGNQPKPSKEQLLKTIAGLKQQLSF